MERAATTVVRGAPEHFPDAYRALHEWIEAGEQATSSERELYIDCDGPRDTWVTEPQTILELDRNCAAAGAGIGEDAEHGESAGRRPVRS